MSSKEDATELIFAQTRPRLEALLQVANRLKVHFSYVAKYMRAHNLPLATRFRRAFGKIVYAFGRWHWPREQLATLRIVITQENNMPSDEPLEIVANIRPDGTMDAEEATEDHLRWFPQPPENTTRAVWPPLDPVITPLDIHTRAGLIYDDVEMIEGELRWQVDELLRSRAWDMALRMRDYVTHRAKALAMYAAVPRDDAPCRAIAAMARLETNPQVCMQWLRTRVTSNMYVYVTMATLMSRPQYKSELYSIITRMKNATLGATVHKVDWLPSIPLYPVTRWMTEDEMFQTLGWKDIDDRGEAGLIIYTRGFGSDVRVNWTTAIEPDRQFEGLTKPFMRKMETIVVSSHPQDEPSVVVHGDTAAEWFVVEACGESLRGWGVDTFTSVPREMVAAWLEGMSDARQRYSSAVQMVPMMRDHAFMMNQYLNNREPAAANDQIRQKVVDYIMKELPQCKKWSEYHEYLLSDKFVETVMHACELAMPKPNVNDVNATHLARVYWIAREFVKSARLIEPQEAVPDNMFSVDLAIKSMRIVMEKTAVRTNETQPWQVEITFKEYLLTKTSMIS